MRNLYIIAIGGSGERILKSFVMLMTAGVPVGAEHIHPVIIDNDEDSHALTQCLDLIRFYRSNPTSSQPKEHGRTGAHHLYNMISADASDWGSFFSAIIDEPVVLNRAGSEIGNLANVIGGIDDESNPLYKIVKEELDLLFTQDDLDMPLNVGFVGNPNIGSIVLNSLSLQEDAFKEIKDNLSSNDGVIVLGSLFGGTGAAGIPLVVNTLHAIAPANRPTIGTVAVLPYFKLQGEDKANIIDVERWDVNSDSFETKTRAALMYYDQYMKDQTDYQYYAGDGDAKDVFDHNVGGDSQNNRTHIVELLSAMSIIDFSKQSSHGNVTYKIPIWGINQSDGVSSTNISGASNAEVKKALAKFQMLKVIFQNPNFLTWAVNNEQNYVTGIGIDQMIIESVAVPGKDTSFAHAWGINNLFQEWDKWFSELGLDTAKRPFMLYKSVTEATDSNIAELFYSNETSGKGIAKVGRRTVGSIFNRHEEEYAIPAEISQALKTVYQKRYPRGVTGIDSEKKIGTMLKIISDALDIVINDKCINF